MLKAAFQSLRRIYRNSRLIKQFLKKEIELHGWKVSPERIKYIFRGFHSDKKYLYNHGDNGIPLPEYITDFERLRTKFINGLYKEALDNKILFSQVFYSLFRCPINFGYQEADGLFTPLEPELMHLREKKLEDVLEYMPARFVMKLVGGGGGKDIYIIERRGDGILINGERGDHRRLHRYINGRRFLMMEYISQGKYANKLYPRSVNTVRVVTAFDENGPWVAFAIQRIGRNESAPTDNFNQGGICSQVDLETGVIGESLYYMGDSRPKAFQNHPDTGATIIGQEVPHWHEIKETLAHAVSQYPAFQYVGWDVVVHDDGFMVLEGNSYPGVQVLQLHEPMLNNKRLAQHLANHGVFSKRRVRQLGLKWPDKQSIDQLDMEAEEVLISEERS
jgi:hypothetical protein